MGLGSHLPIPPRLQTGMRGAFGKPQGTVARVHIGQVIMSIRTKAQNKEHVVEALRRAKFKFPGRQKVPGDPKIIWGGPQKIWGGLGGCGVPQNLWGRWDKGTRSAQESKVPIPGAPEGTWGDPKTTGGDPKKFMCRGRSWGAPKSVGQVG